VALSYERGTPVPIDFSGSVPTPILYTRTGDAGSYTEAYVQLPDMFPSLIVNAHPHAHETTRPPPAHTLHPHGQIFATVPRVLDQLRILSLSLAHSLSLPPSLSFPLPLPLPLPRSLTHSNRGRTPAHGGVRAATRHVSVPNRRRGRGVQPRCGPVPLHLVVSKWTSQVNHSHIPTPQIRRCLDCEARPLLGTCDPPPTPPNNLA